jgi:1-acyl-sn-glycerol-3-phosphate acyltransferase
MEAPVKHRESSDAADGDAGRRLLDLIGELASELHPQKMTLRDVTLASRLERDLGIDSLGRTELILRIQRAFRVRLPLEVVGKAETVRDLLDALGQAAPRSLAAPSIAPSAPELAPVAAATDARTLLEVLDWHVNEHADRPHVTVLEDDVTVLGTMTYGELAHAARSVAAGLIKRDVVPGDRVALMLPTSQDFFAAFFGILYAGAVPVPIYPPVRMSQIEEHFRRQAGILRNAGARLLVTVPEVLRLAALLRAQVESLAAVESVASIMTEPSGLRLPAPPDENAIALIQYTSGSTGDPKGVVLTHANLLANIRTMGRAMEGSSADVFVSWLPLYHDMGLIGAWLGCLHFAAPLYVMSPLAFLVRPQSWLWAIHRYRATLSAAPNFGFELSLNKIDDADIEGLDLNSLRMLCNGAEPVSVHTLRRFTERFGRYGFKPGAMAPVYGLAENSVGLAFPPLGREPVIDQVDRDALMTRGEAEPAKPGAAKPLEIVSCGKPLPDHEIRIVDQSGRELGERREGRLEFRGPSATSGYFGNEAKTRELIHDGWLDSGDRAYIADGDVFITGRIKDIIIRAGRNIYPEEVEEAVSGIDGIRKGCVAVFGTPDPASATERIIVLAETRATDPAELERLRTQVHEVATDILSAPADDVVLAPPRTVPKTSSGKIRRSAAKELYEQGRIGAEKRALWWQILRLSLAGVRPQLALVRQRAGALPYAAWWWTIVALGFALGWPAIMVLPRLEWRWSALRRIARLAFAAMGVRISTNGIERIPTGSAVLVFNHSSYLDSLVLAAVLPGEPAFVAKRELAGQIIAGPILRRLGVVFVERFDLAGGVADTDAVTALARHGRVIVFFPEGTFTRRTGLAGFYLGAFKIASDTNLPVLPGIIRGTRTMLRGEQWFPRWSPIEVEIAEAIKPSGTDFSAAVQLRDQVRAAMLARSKEPDLGDLAKPVPPPAASGD